MFHLGAGGLKNESDNHKVSSMGVGFFNEPQVTSLVSCFDGSDSDAMAFSWGSPKGY
jgi:hypothetical protein